MRGTPVLFERVEASRLIGSALDPAARGGVVVVEGVPGIGKSALLASLAGDRRRRTFAARGYEQESAFPFGVVRQLFDRAVHDGLRLEGAAALAMGVLGPATGTVADAMPVFHGLYWLTSGLSEAGPITLVVDDAQWADEPSLGFLAYLARRVADLPVTVVVATRPLGPSAPPAVRDVLLNPGAVRVELDALSCDGVRLVLVERLGAGSDVAIDESFVAACQAATGGNPFLLHALVDEVRDLGLAPTEATAARVGSLTPGGASRAIAARLARLGVVERRVADAAAVMGDGARLRDVAAVAGVDDLDAAAIAVVLCDAGLLRIDGDTLSCAHAIVRTSVLSLMDELVTASWHRAAADVLRAHGRADSEIAVHLTELRELCDEDVATLVGAAAAATALGAPDVAASLLVRVAAAREGTPAHGHALLLLGEAETAAGLPDAERHLRSAVEALPEGSDRWLASLNLARACKFGGRATQAVSVLEEALAAAASARHPLAVDLELELVGLAYSSVSARRTVLHHLDPSPAPSSIGRSYDAFVAAALAFEAALAGEDHQRAVRLASRAARQEPLPTDPLSGTGFGVLMAANALMWCDLFDDAERLHGRVVDAARLAGAPVALSTVLSLRALVRWRTGRLAEAEADAAEAVELVEHSAAPPPLLPAAIAAGALLALERSDDGDLAGVDGLLSVNVDPDGTPYGLVVHARGRFLVATGHLAEGAEELLAAGAFEERWGAYNPAVLPWRSDAARALVLLGRAEQAIELVEEELRRARAFGAPRAIGVALAGAAATASGHDRVRLLDEAAGVLCASGARLEHARTLVELGEAHRLLRSTDDAIHVLRHALDRASAIGAFRLARVTTEGLRACGVRRPRHAVTGVDALTPSERRVVELAAAGATNKGIAQQLFVSTKTVETHLSNAYDKLGVRDRRRLGELVGLS